MYLIFFLQILDEGHLTDGQGRTVSFKNCIIIMTSNIGSDIILEAKELNDKVKEEIEKLLHKYFRPEFLNRIDAIVFFRMLTHEDVVRIAQLQIERLKERLAQRNIELTVSKEVLDKIATLGYEKEFGARPLKRAIQHYLAAPISEYLLKHPDTKTLNVSLKKDVITLS